MGLAALGKSVGALYKLGKRAFKVLPDLVVGEGACSSESIAKVMRKTKGSIFTKLEAGARSVEKSVLSQKEGFWTRTWNSLKSIPSNLKKSAVDGYKAAEKANKNKIWGGTKGAFKFLQNKTQLLIASWILWSQMTNAYDAIKDKGLMAGLWEIAKSPFHLGGGVAGAAIGTLCIPIPFVGPVIGWLAGEAAVSGVIGKPYTVKKEEAEAKEMEVLAKYGLKKDENGTLAYDTESAQNGQSPVIPQIPSTDNSSSSTLDNYFSQEQSLNNPYMAYNNPSFSGMNGMNGLYGMNGLNGMTGLNGMGGMFGGNNYYDDIMAQSLNFNG